MTDRNNSEKHLKGTIMAATHTMPEQGNTLPRWVYIALGLACIPMGFWASYITLQYFEHGAAALEADPSLRALALSAALMFVASEMAAFALAALLTERQLWARRWMLTGFAAAVLLLEICTIVAVQLALTVGGEMSQTTVQDQEKDLRARIGAIESGAAAKRADAAQLRAAGQLSKASKSSDGATAEQAQTAALYGELTKVQSQKRPTLVGLLGKEYALAYAVARGILVSLGGLVFFGTAGALLRAGRGATGRARVTVAPAAAPSPAAGAPDFKQAAVMPKGASRAWAAGAVPLAAMGATMAHAAPAVPAMPAAAGALTQAHQSPISAPAQAHQSPESAPAQAQAVTPTSAPTPPAKAKKERAPSAVEDGQKRDTGTTGKASGRYERIKSAVAGGKLKPSIRALQAEEGGGSLVARRYLHQLEAEGVTVRVGRNWKLATE